MRHRTAVVLITLASLSCRGHGLRHGRLPNLSPDLIAYSGAQTIQSSVTLGFERLNYELDVAYPARPVIQSIAAQLASRGWHPTRNSWFNRDEASEYLRGWVQSTVVGKPRGKERFLARWWAQWQNDRGDVLDYSLTYLSPTDQFTNQNRLRIQEALMSASVARQISSRFQESAANRPVILLPIGTPPNAETATDNSPDPHVFRVRPDGG